MHSHSPLGKAQARCWDGHGITACKRNTSRSPRRRLGRIAETLFTHQQRLLGLLDLFLTLLTSSSRDDWCDTVGGEAMETRGQRLKVAESLMHEPDRDRWPASFRSRARIA